MKKSPSDPVEKNVESKTLSTETGTGRKCRGRKGAGAAPGAVEAAKPKRGHLKRRTAAAAGPEKSVRPRRRTSASAAGQPAAAVPAAEQPTNGGSREFFFTYSGIPGCRVCLAGSFNGWSVDALPLADLWGDGRYSCSLALPPGRYEYKLVIDGEWRLDENNPAVTDNEFGSRNNVLVIE